MVNNSTNINKMNNNPSPQTIEHKKDHRIYDIGNADSQACNKHKHVGFIQVNGIQPYPS